MLAGRIRIHLFCAAVLLTLTGCPEEQATVAVPEPVAIQPIRPAEPVNPNSIEINVGETYKTTDCQVQLLTFSGDRPSVLMIKSYIDAQQETLPSAMIQSQVSARDPASLAGTTLKAELYLMTPDVANAAPAGRAGPTTDVLAGITWHTPQGEPVNIRITSVANQRIVGEIVGGELINTLTRRRQPVKGRFTGPMQ